MANTVEFCFEEFSDWADDKKKEVIISADSVRDKSVAALTAYGEWVLNRAHTYKSLVSIFADKDVNNLGVKLVTALPELELISIEQVGSIIRLVAIHHSASCDEIGKATLSILGGVLVVGLDGGEVGIQPGAHRLAHGSTLGEIAGAQLGKELWEAAKLLSPKNKTCYADILGMKIGFQAKANDGSLGSVILSKITPPVSNVPDVQVLLGPDSSITVQRNIGGFSSRLFKSTDLDGDASA